jgi:methyl-accepting chemotaxis protein
MDFHNMRRMRRGVAAFLAVSAPLPALAAIGAWYAAPQLQVLSPVWAMAGAAALSAAWAGAVGWWLGERIEAPLRRWVDVTERVYMKQEFVPDVPFTDHRGALGKLARFSIVSRDWLAERAREAKENAEALKVTEAARAAQEEEAALKAREQSTVVTALAAALSDVATGTLTTRVTEDFPADYQQLKDDFNAALDKLQEAMRGLKTSSSGIRAGTEEISQSAEDLSRRTESQAASLEETAAALDHITETVRKAADGAAEASSVVLTAKSDAEASGQIVRDAVGAMSEIERSAQQISQIIGVIDEIAFQTNLLALNAGVEAARAGEAGRGFAVVASEVRALAQRSAGAAKEIKALISTSSAQVNTGVQLVGQTGQALERIVTRVAEINGLVADIAASAKEQALGLHEINASINQMDHTTQQNAAMVQETTAACVALASEAQQLTAMIGRFDIGAEVAAPKPTFTAATPRATEWTPRRSRAARVAGGLPQPSADADGLE